jgi:glycosyltransferase involved in cell wall biosynthesis
MAVNSKVSVCMAVYNGAPYLGQQVQSIRSQLRPADELIVADDASQDDSISILQSMDDPRLHVVQNDGNIGVLGTFEKALHLATGDVLFLSDQDDLWLSGKLEKVLQVFATRPDVTMVATDAAIIDEKGDTIAPSFFAQRGRFAPGPVHNFLKNKYLGCTLSFRREMLPIFLPIPPDVPMHDIWFGVLNGIYGRTYFIDEPLVAYRRHGRNASSVVSFSAGLGKVALWRYRLAKNLARRVIGRTLGSA